MVKKYFPGANTGRGFMSRFGGIVPPWEEPHYTYVLKGGPGVGKNTLMRKVATLAESKGMTVEEFRCASDPDSFDAVRIAELRTVLLDGTAPHSIDPVMPGIGDEVVDLGHFKNRKDFEMSRGDVERLSAENSACYRAAYALLGAARCLKSEALDAAARAMDTGRLRSFLAQFIGGAKDGGARELFAASATPVGVVDFSESFLQSDTVYLSGILGEVAIGEAVKMLGGKAVSVGYGFVEPSQPRVVDLGERSLAVGEGETLIGLCASPLPTHISHFLSESEALVKAAVDSLSGALRAHDAIEEIYRDYVDYDRVNEESEALLRTLGLQ